MEAAAACKTSESLCCRWYVNAYPSTAKRLTTALWLHCGIWKTICARGVKALSKFAASETSTPGGISRR